MVALVTLQQVKEALRVDTSDDDTWLTLLIGSASNRIIQFLKGRADDVLNLDSGGEPTSAGIPDEAAVATIMLVGYYYRNPDQDPDGDFERGYLPKPVSSLLYMLRDPTLA